MTDEPMNWQEFADICEADKKRHIQIIGMYAHEKRPCHNTKNQWYKSFIPRNCKAAKRLQYFSDLQIYKAFKEVKNAKPPIPRWTLETVEKYMEEVH